MKTKTFTLSGSFLILFSTLIIFQNGCKKKSDDSTVNQQNIPSTTKVIDTTSWRNNFISVDTTNYTFTFNNALLNHVVLKPGDIMVSAVGLGYLRKIDSVRQSGNNLIIHTSFASLAEAVNNGSLSFNFDLTSKKIKKIQYLKSGISIGTSQLKSKENPNLDYNIDTYFDNGHLIHLTGQFSILPTINGGLVISGFALKSFNIEYSVQEQINLEATVELLNLQYDDEVEIAKVIFDPIIVWIDFVPVVLEPELELDAGADLKVQSDVTTNANQQLTYTVGLNYANNQWTPSQSFNNSFSYQPPELTATAGAKVYIKPKLQIAVYGFISPYLFGEGYTRIQAVLNATPWWSLYEGASVGAGVNMEIFGLSYDYKTNFFEYEKLIASADTSLSTVTTDSITNIAQTTAVGGGNVTSQGSSSVTARGVCYSTSQNPTIANSHTTNGSGTGSFTSNITGLTANTLYYVRAYATNSTGTGYGNLLSFKTLPAFSIGQHYGGGIIFYIDSTGLHGLISATSDQSTGAPWGCNTTFIVTGIDIGTGQANTTAIVNGCSESGIAARICDDLVLNGYSDWFLPSFWELGSLWWQKDVVGGFANNGTNSAYWSSSEYDDNLGNSLAYLWDFFTGGADVENKFYLLHVRAVRAF